MNRRLDQLLGFQVCYRDLWLLAALALVLRLGYLVLGLQTLDIEGVTMWAHDTGIYLSIAQYWISGDPFGEQMLFLGGPGYGALLAFSQLLFGQTPWPPLVLNLLLGCAAPVIVYLTAMLLVDRRPVALLSGLLVCVSWTGVSVSLSLLTDQPFYTLHALAILMFVLGLKTDETRWYVASGITAGVATYIRTMGQVWPVVFVFTALLFVLTIERRARWRRFARSLWAPAILLALVLVWSSVNYSRYGVFTFTGNGPRAAWQYLGARALAMNTPGLTTEEARDGIAADLDAAVVNSELPQIDIYHICRRKSSQLLSEHPAWVLRAFIHNVWENVRVSNNHLYVQLPQFKPLWDVLTRAARETINPWIFWGSLIGLVLLLVDRQRLAWIVLGPTYAVFTLLMGFSFWQGSRLHLPAEMAWSILLAYVLIRLREWLWDKVRTIRNRRVRIGH